MYIDHLFTLSRVSVSLASFAVIVSAVAYLLRNKHHDLDRILATMQRTLADLAATMAEMSRLHQDELDHRLELMKTQRTFSQDIRSLGDQIGKYRDTCQEMHEIVRRSGTFSK